MDSDAFNLPHRFRLSTVQKILVFCGLIILSGFIILGAIRLFHRGRLLPGTSAYGIYLGSTTREEAITILTKESAEYSRQAKILVNSKGSAPTSLAVNALGIQYDPTAAVDQVYKLGRSGNPVEQLGEELGLLTGTLSIPDGPVSFQSQAAYQAIAPTYAKISMPVTDAKFGLSPDNLVTLIPEKNGERVNLTRYLDDLNGILSHLDRTAISLQSYTLPAQVSTQSLEEERRQISNSITQPLTLKDGQKSWALKPAELLSWYTAPVTARSIQKVRLTDYYRQLPVHAPSITLDTSRIATSLSTIAKQVDQPAVDAKLTIAGNRATVFQQSQDGREINIPASIDAIRSTIERASTSADLVVNLTKAQVNDATIDQLGIHDLLSEGVTYFPGSSADRLTNVRVGQALYNNYLLKPDQVFSFGEILGDVGPAQGYRPGLIILADHEEKAYGGGLCQVSSTAFRAALLAGLPIVERVNHAFAVNFYTAPYGVPGIDATIYYPQVDFKFKNDTGNYILIQTEMVGTTLKFRYYGTKKKEGVIRGPNFIYGSNNPNQPSQTVFYRDVLVDGKVTKTDTFKTTYKSALDYPVAD